eukprot:GFKZ01008245.1.p1 GENE.GFKZ01008245.1~~GFKZ01008245.1.p1  ORF type:complete len:204 (-),score=19.23 GFKZ01008245.1:334-882(-)
MLPILLPALLLLLLPPTPAHSRALLALDRTLSSPLVAQLNTTVHYTIHNIGTHAATDLLLKDNSFPPSRFTVHSGNPRLTIPSLQPDDSFSTSVQLTPKRAGHLIVTPPTVAYTDHLNIQHVSAVATDDHLIVEPLVEFRRRTEKFRLEWALYSLAFTLLVAAPALVSTLTQRAVLQTKKKA